MRTGEDDYTAYVAASWPRLFRTAHALTGDPHEAEDLLQTALVKAYGSWARVSRAANRDAYVRRMLVNQLISWRRRPLHRSETTTADVPDAGTAGPELGITESGAMWQALATLPPRQRAVVVLRYYEDLSETEIAAVLGIAPGTVKSQCSGALRTLRARLGHIPTSTGSTS